MQPISPVCPTLDLSEILFAKPVKIDTVFPLETIVDRKGA